MGDIQALSGDTARRYEEPICRSTATEGDVPGARHVLPARSSGSTYRPVTGPLGPA